MTDDAFNLWGNLGEEWWQENGRRLKCTDRQIRFAAARHARANQGKAAELAGYPSGDQEALRVQGARTAASERVRNLLALAEAEDAGTAGTEDGITQAEIDRRLARMIRSPDATISLKAIESHAKREENRRQRGDAPSDDGMSDWRTERDCITLPNGGSAYLLLQGGQLANLKLLHDTHAVVMREPGGPELWARFYAQLGSDARAELDRYLRDPGYQLDARRKIWAEVGQPPPGPISSDAVDMLRRGPSLLPDNSAEASANAA
jgi:hypothetical protein